ncbi:cytochrome P450 [Penicillium longicatenatum]|uniref:cytochrome P450 n=1 Tax=Penicillium longicatenatum TaxID=1561947 RepID=UPI002547C7AD|nr:cytochrome P450 [Penicillium longicatenatum]KAJ5631589.1 cytochrome P450 [Penicillium longicatenatum]
MEVSVGLLRSPERVLLYLVILYSAFTIIKRLFRVLFSPLNKLPGPAWARITSLPIVLKVITGKRAQELDILHKKYGSVVRIGPNEVSVGDYRYYRPIYNDSKSTTKDTDFYSIANFVGKSNIFQMTNPAQHSARRRLSAAPYSLQGITLLSPLIRRKAEDLARNLLKRATESPNGTADAFELSGLYSLEVICEAGFAMDLSAMGGDLGLKLMHAMDGSAQTLMFTSTVPWLRSTGLGKRLPGHVGACYRKDAYWQQKSREMVDHFLRASFTGASTEKNLLAPLLHGTDSFLGRKLTYEELVEEAMGIMFAGSGTTSATLTYMLYALSCPENEGIQVTLRDEVMRLPPNDIVAVRNCPYLNAVIKETFRLFPTIISTLPRLLGEPLQLGEYILPAGTVVGMQNYVHHRDSSVFPKPERFYPERWLTSTKEMDMSLTPFSLGRRNCIGQNLAFEELYVAIEVIMRSGLVLRLGKEMENWEMGMEDRFNIAPKGRRLMLEVVEE